MRHGACTSWHGVCSLVEASCLLRTSLGRGRQHWEVVRVEGLQGLASMPVSEQASTARALSSRLSIPARALLLCCKMVACKHSSTIGVSSGPWQAPPSQADRAAPAAPLAGRCASWWRVPRQQAASGGGPVLRSAACCSGSSSSTLWRTRRRSAGGGAAGGKQTHGVQAGRHRESGLRASVLCLL